MALNKSNLEVNFSQGLDTKTDPFQVQPGKFLSLKNSVFTKAGLLQKRNGFGPLTTLPDNTSKYLTTFNGNLTAIGTSLSAYSQSTGKWSNKGPLQPAELSVLPLIRSNTNQTQVDAVVADNGLVCTVYTDVLPSGTVYRYAIADSVTGQNIIAPTAIAGVTGVTTGSPRVFILGPYFIIVFTNVITAVSHLQYIAISIQNPTTVTAAADIASAYVSSTTLSWDGVVAANKLFIAYNNVTGGQNVKVTYLATNLTVTTPATFAGVTATLMSVTADETVPSSPAIWITAYNVAGPIGRTWAVDSNLNTLLVPTVLTLGAGLVNITSWALNGVNTIYYEVAGVLSYDAGIAIDDLHQVTVTISGTVGSPSTLILGLGLASKATVLNGVPYILTIYNSPSQPTYFLLKASDATVVAKLAYSNGGTYLTLGLPSITLIDTLIQIPYRVKDLIAGINKEQGAASPSGVYSQTGLNLAFIDIGAGSSSNAEIGGNLNISGGQLWAYDGYSVVEQGFHLWPDYVEATTSTSGGFLASQQYFYQVTYEWADNQGNVFRSAPSIPITITTTGGSTSANTIHVPTLKVTYKTANPIKIVVYRWSVAQQTYYAITSPSAAPTFNDPQQESVAIVDTLADSSIIGNPILYTTGGVLENIGPPATNVITLFNNRLWLLDAEDPNLLWYSKQVIESTPVEMSDLLTLYVAPSTSAQGSTGATRAMAPLDDKLILFKKDAAYYINGIGPDNTGANSQYSDATFITATVGCENQNSIVFMPQGLMFQSDKGIWLLGRDLNTTYIGAPVEEFTTGATVLSAVNVPGTNQVRFTMDSGITLMYDYYFGQWGSFTNIPALSSTLFDSMHTYVDTYGRVFQETIGLYLDNSSPVLMSFQTGWMSLAGIQGYERFYQMYLLGNYLSPFKLDVQLAYDYNPSLKQSTIVRPDRPGPAWGGDQLWGSGSPWGGPASVFEARVFPQIQKCESFQISVNEIYDATLGIAAGAGLTLSGMNLVVGMKKGYRTSTSSRSFG